MLAEGDSHVNDLLPAFVLDALTNVEMHHVSEHLAGCPACQAELARLQRVADELPLALTQTAPAPELKRKLMQSIHSRQPHLSMKLAPATRRRGFFAILPAISLALIILLVASNLLLWRQLNSVLQPTSMPMRIVALTGSQISPGAQGTMVMTPTGRYGTLVVADLSALNSGQQYQVWLIRGTDHYSVGVFSVDQNGYAAFQIAAPQPFQQYDAIGISVEPAGGSLQPTGPNVLRAQLTR